MNRKISLGVTILLGLCLSFFTSCDDDNDDPSKPEITLEEVGHENSKAVAPGSDLHLEAIITAEGIIKQIDVEIHQEDGSYEIEESYTDSKYVGVKNVTFHEHIDIPADAPEGDYHLHLTVTDEMGQTSTAEAELSVNAEAEHSDHEH
ncbi:DUF4625 domain-containing protein [Massilibacteroides sp.]|uniref:DUF4625 domain-containing protein n=1 Tax=Massilibacteroides sp. TaxID=2034766 RepID=UPI00261A583E|nr:DUF4625 domain-containing protein [Massilibacteroides sp.]MDD4514690.1 DUF4625 domain-containing protein [Massilibacteroides sp.]